MFVYDDAHLSITSSLIYTIYCSFPTLYFVSIFVSVKIVVSRAEVYRWVGYEDQVDGAIRIHLRVAGVTPRAGVL